MVEDRTFGGRLKAYRRRARLSQEDLAERSGISVRTIGGIERGQIESPHPATLRRLTGVFDGLELQQGELSAEERLPHQLPPNITAFTGRRETIEELRELLDQTGPEAPRMVTISGSAGIGKTALAVHLAHQVFDRFPDGQLYVDLRGVQERPLDPAEVLGRFLRALNIEGTMIPADTDERCALYRSVVAGRRLLVVLDNAADERQVRPLLPGTPGCTVLVTSRRCLLGLESTHRITLDLLDIEEGLALLSKVAGPARIGDDPASHQLVLLCAGLPLALRIVAARLASRPDLSATRLAALLAQEHHRLDELAAGDLQVRASVGTSYQNLGEEQRVAFRRLGLLDTPDFPAWILAALLGDAGSSTAVAHASTLLEQLVDAQLVQPVTGNATGQARYRLHDLIRLYARERVLREESAQDRYDAQLRALSGLLALAEEADERLPSGEYAPLPRTTCVWRLESDLSGTVVADPVRWFETERIVLIIAVEQAADLAQNEITWRLAGALTAFFELQAHFQDWQRTHDHALVAAQRAGDAHAAGRILCRLGDLHLARHRLPVASECLERALRVLGSAGDTEGEAHALQALSHVHRLAGRVRLALDCARRAIELLELLSERRGLAGALYYLGNTLVDNGRPGEALPHYHRALAFDRDAGDRRGEALTLLQLGRAHLALHDHEVAGGCLLESLVLVRRLGDRRCEAHVLQVLGTLHHAAGRPAEALRVLESALAIAQDMDDSGAQARILHALGEARLSLGELSSAGEMLTEALAAATDLEWPVLREQARAALERATANTE